MLSSRVLRRHSLLVRTIPEFVPQSRVRHQGHAVRRVYTYAPAQTLSSHGVQQFPASSTNAQIRTPGRARRALRSALWASLFFVSGFIVMQVAVTLPYLRKTRRTPGSERDLKLLQMQIDQVDSSHLVHELKAQGWVEDAQWRSSVSKDAEKGKHLVHETLPRPGIRGLTTRVFRWPASKVSLVVVHIGPGCESWPQYAHGGVTTTLLLEAIENHFVHYYPELAVPTAKDMTVKFKAPVQIYGVYAIVVPPVVNQEENGKLFVDLEAQFDNLSTPPKIVNQPASTSIGTNAAKVKKSNAQTLATAKVRMAVVQKE